MPLRQTPWRLKWVVGTAAFKAAPLPTLARLVGWTLAECFQDRLTFKVGPFRFVTMPNNFCGLWSHVANAFEPELVAFAAGSVKPGDVFVDVGANIGMYSAHASRSVGPTGQVIAFEAHPLTATVFAENVAGNDLANVTLVRAAVGEAPGELEMAFESGDAGSTHVAVVGDRRVVKVPVVTLDAELERLGVSRVDYLKIDVEGFEPFVLRGALETIRRNPGIRIQTEIDERHLRRYGSTPADVFALLEGVGLRGHALGEGGALTPVTSAAYGDVIWFR